MKVLIILLGTSLSWLAVSETNIPIEKKCSEMRHGKNGKDGQNGANGEDGEDGQNGGNGGKGGNGGAVRDDEDSKRILKERLK